MSWRDRPAIVALTIVALLGGLIVSGLGAAEWLARPDGSTPWLEPAWIAVTLALLGALAVLVLAAVDPRRFGGELDPQARLLLDLPPSALLAVDATGVIRRCNPAVETVFGRAPSSVVGSQVGELFAAADREEAQRRLASQTPGAPPSSFQLAGVRGDGTTIPLLVYVAATAGKGRTLTGLYIRDISEREELVGELAGHAAELARSNRELEQFAYVASHDLQEPLRMVGSFTQILHQRYHGKLDADADEFLNYAQQGAQRMRELIDDLLAYSRIGSRAAPFRKVETEAVLTTALQNLRGSIEASKATITHGPLPAVEADATQLGQVFQNLIGNALKFRGEGPARVEVSAERKGAEWVFAFRDHGIGIEPKYHERIFVIFQRLHTREEYPGSGIGLAVCRKVIERHGGRIWLESDGVPGAGSTFFFSLPVERVRSTPAPSAPATTPRRAEVAAQAKNLIEERLRELS